MVLEVSVPVAPAQESWMVGLFSVTVQEETFVALQLTCVVSPLWTRDGTTEIVPVGGGGGRQEFPAHPYAPHACMNCAAHCAVR